MWGECARPVESSTSDCGGTKGDDPEHRCGDEPGRRRARSVVGVLAMALLLVRSPALGGDERDSASTGSCAPGTASASSSSGNAECMTAAVDASPRPETEAAVAVPRPAVASSPPVDETAPQAVFTAPEIVVTARMIEENAQKVPITVSLLDTEQLKQQGIERVSDLTYAVPSLTIHPYFNTLTNSYSIRGLSAGQATYFSESPCCSGNASIPFTDIESVQVLNGPQGTLFGRSSASGAILIRPVHPDLTRYGEFVELRVGNYGRTQLSGGINVPLLKDRLAIRIAASFHHVDGFTEAIGSRLRFDEQANRTFRLGATAKVGRFENYVVATYVDLDQSATNQILSGVYPGAAGGLYNLPAEAASAVFGAVCTNAVALGLESSVSACVTSRYNHLVAIRTALLAEYARVSAGGRAVRFEPTPVNGNPARLRLRNFNVVDVAEVDLTDRGPLALRLKNIFSFESAADVASSPADGIGGLAEQGGASTLSGLGSNNQSGRHVVARLGPRADTFNNELQLHVDAHDGLIVGTIGLFYNHSRQPATTLGTGNVYQIFGGVFNENLGYNSALGFSAGGSGGETAIYAQATTDLARWIRGLKLTAGYRFSWTRTTFASRPAVTDSLTGVFSPGPSTSVVRTKSSGPNVHLALSEELSDKLMTYLSFSRAYVPGGVNVYDSGQAGGDPASALPSFAPTYGPEKVFATELGVKWDFTLAKGAGRINADVYHYAFRDIQENFSGTFNNVGFFYTANIAAATHRGFETSVTFVPSSSWELRLAYNYNDFYYTRWTGQDPANVAQVGDAICVPSSPSGYCFLDLRKNPAVGMPPHQGHLTLVYRLPLAFALGKLDLSATLYGQTRVYFQSDAHRELQILGPGALQAYSQDPYSILNLRASWSNIRGSRWGVGLFVDNVGDRVYKVGTTAQVLSLGFGTATYGPPRMFGVELTRRF